MEVKLKRYNNPHNYSKGFEDNILTEIEGMEATKVCSLGQITESLFEVGGQYRRNM